MPDMILFMDLPVQQGLARTFDKDGDKRERMDVAFFEKVYEGYQQLFDFEPTQHLMHRIDAQGSIEEITDRILYTVQ